MRGLNFVATTLALMHAMAAMEWVTSLSWHPGNVNMQTFAGGQPENAYMWANFTPSVGSCSVVRSTNTSFLQNFAANAGGAVYATDKATLGLGCLNEQAIDPESGCAASSWQGNAVGALG